MIVSTYLNAALYHNLSIRAAEQIFKSGAKKFSTSGLPKAICAETAERFKAISTEIRHDGKMQTKETETLLTYRRLPYSKEKHRFDLKLQSENSVRCLILYRCVRSVFTVLQAGYRYKIYGFYVFIARPSFCTYGIYGCFFSAAMRFVKSPVNLSRTYTYISREANNCCYKK